MLRSVLARNRLGSRCGVCAPGYRPDRPLAGEFALCVRCFCNFHSSSCDPETGVCFNCTDNTVGPSCEMCQDGYYRPSHIIIDSCVECDCNPNGTVGNVCNVTVSTVCVCVTLCMTLCVTLCVMMCVYVTLCVYMHVCASMCVLVLWVILRWVRIARDGCYANSC